MTDVGRVALAARVFTVAALTSLAAVAGPRYFDGALLVVLTAAIAQAVAMVGRVPEHTVALFEGGVIAALAVLARPDQATVTPYLVIPVLIAAVDLGRVGMLRVIAAEFVVLVATSAIVIQGWDRQFAAGGFTWLSCAVGIGLMGVALRRAMSTTDADASYRSAVGLIRRLEALSGKLSGGLDAVGIAEQVMGDADTVVPTRSAGVFVQSDNGTMAPLRYSAGTLPGAMAWAGALAAKCWEYEAMVLRESRVAIPLLANDEMIAVLVLETLGEVESTTAVALRNHLGRHAVQLQAALLFGRVRDTATSEERQRIAREVHDGVAQDVASLGYLVDNLAIGTSDPDQQARIGQLRSEVTRVVTELRHSIFDLRHELAAGSGLGESLSAYANHVSTTSPMAVHVTLDEQGPRLPADVEYELLRIAQEAMANARKHSGAANLWLRCTIRPPYAEIEVRDDGTNAHTPRSDSQGLKIMRERSRTIGAELVVTEPTTDRPGTQVTVRVGSPARERTR
ncbi:sensor histidine kinase [Marmoricola sp. URHB0036]|uniref:sensor histidine kinase n=1 Tax=Marmoricola sp. URHB0036 TaxID=1298863 RepID=UPI0003F8F0C5|nr:histidine kinase [Marmoricola sp. URHB0036]